ncbi:MAG: hypothetical protein ACKVTZ_04660 [Bacteroidia bacterium]
MQSIIRSLPISCFLLMCTFFTQAQGQDKTLATTSTTRSLTANSETPHNIRLLGTATDFQRLHTGMQAVSAKSINVLKVGEEFCIDLQIPSPNDRWLVQVSDVSTVKAVLDQAFQGKMIADGMPNLHTWKFKAAKAGECEIVFVLPITDSKEQESVVYKVSVR